MNGTEVALRTLDGEIAKGLAVLERIVTRLTMFEQSKVSGKEPGQEEAMVAAQYLSNYYTCCETIFLRISRHFENNLPPDRWHQALLEKMTLEVPGIRPQVLEDAVRGDLLELLKFRHFSRYYFELDYDWDKLRFLLNKMPVLHNAMLRALGVFRSFIGECVGKTLKE